MSVAKEIEEIKEKVIYGLSNNIAKMDNIVVDHSVNQSPTISCRVTAPFDIEMRGGWTRPPKRVSYEDYVHHYYLKAMRDYRSYRDYCGERDKNKIENVIFNNPATIVFWGDGSKTVVKCNEDEFDPEKGLAMAIAKHFLGTNKSKGNYYNVFEKWIPKEKEKELPLGLKYEEDNIYTEALNKYAEKFEEESKEIAIKALNISTLQYDEKRTDSNATDNGGN